eukprot:3368154-Rhodomonas_salina.1
MSGKGIVYVLRMCYAMRGIRLGSADLDGVEVREAVQPLELCVLRTQNTTLRTALCRDLHTSLCSGKLFDVSSTSAPHSPR